MFGKSLQILTIYHISGLSIFIQPITKCKIDSLYIVYHCRDTILCILLADCKWFYLVHFPSVYNIIWISRS